MADTLPQSVYTRDQIVADMTAHPGKAYIYYGHIFEVPADVPGDDVLTQWANDAAGALITAADVTTIAATVAQQAISTPIPVTIMTGDYSALVDDQRIAHDSPGDYTLTPMPPDQVPFRRFVFSNGYAGGKLTLAGTFISPVAMGTAMVQNPVLPPGASVDVIARFVVGAGSTAAPDGLRMNGQPAPSGTVGQWMMDVVAVNVGSPSATDFANLQEDVMSYTPQSVQRADRIASAATTLLATDLELKLNASAGTFAVTIPSTLPAGDYPVLFEVGPLANAPTWTLGSGSSVDSSQGSLPAWTVVGQVYTVHSSGNGVFNVD